MTTRRQITHPRILIDGYYLGKPSGYGRFVSELCGALGKTRTELQFVVAVTDRTEPALLVPAGNLRFAVVPERTFPFWEQVVIPFCARRHGCSVVHHPYNTSSIFKGRRKSVVTVHDVTFLESGNERDLRSTLIHAYMRAGFHLGSRSADCIVSVSEATRGRLTEMGMASTRVYNSVDEFVAMTGPHAAARPARPYFLHRGSYAAGHRNTARIIEAFVKSPILTQHYSLKVLGVPEGARHWAGAIGHPVEFLPRVTDAELAAIYRGSAGVIAASLLEGFCLPIVEGFGFGVPVIASDIDPMKEIAGQAALLVAPHDVDAIGRAMERLASEPGLAEDLVRRGRERYTEFSGRSMAERLISVYRTVLGGARPSSARLAQRAAGTDGIERA